MNCQLPSVPSLNREDERALRQKVKQGTRPLKLLKKVLERKAQREFVEECDALAMLLPKEEWDLL